MVDAIETQWLTIRQTEFWLRKIRFSSALLALLLWLAAAGGFALWGSPKLSPPYRYILAGVLFALGVLCLVCVILRTRRLSRAPELHPLHLQRQAADYYRVYCRTFRPFRLVRLLLLTAALGIALAFVLLPNLLWLALPLVTLLVFSIGLYFFYNGLFCRRITVSPIEGEDTEEETFSRRKELRNAILFTVLYALLFGGLYVGLSLYFAAWTLFLYIPLFAFLAFFLFALMGNPFARYASLRSKRLIVKILRLAAVAGLVAGCLWAITAEQWLLFGYIDRVQPLGSPATVIRYNEETGVYTLTPAGKENVRILQLTDIHLGGSLTTLQADLAALSCCEALIREAKPDLVIVTGDLLFPLPLATFSRNNEAPLVEFCWFMEKLGVPWAFVYGNHDTELVATLDAAGVNRILSAFSYESDGRNLLFSSVQPDIYGRYNQVIEIAAQDGSIDRLLFLLDSNDYTVQTINANQYDTLHADQIEWYRDTVEAYTLAEGRTVPSLLFFHIPLREFETAALLYGAGDPSVTYLFGSNGEPVSHAKGEDELFETALALGSTQAIFVGHDHLNNLALCYRGIDLVFGMSVDYLVYPGISQKTSQRGGTVIELAKDKDCFVWQLPLLLIK